MLYKEWLNEWLAVCVRPTAKARTYEKYDRICRRHLTPKLGEYEMEMLSASVLQRFVAGMIASLSPNTVNVVISVLKKSLKQAVVYGVAERQYSDGIIRPKLEEKRVECFTKEEQKKIEEYILQSKKQKLIGILLCLYSGLRIGELMALTWENIDFTEGLLSVTRSCHDGWGENGYEKLLETSESYRKDVDDMSSMMQTFASECENIKERIDYIRQSVSDVNAAVEESAKGITVVTDTAVTLTGSVNDIGAEAANSSDIADGLLNEVNKFKL